MSNRLRKMGRAIGARPEPINTDFARDRMFRLAVSLVARARPAIAQFCNGPGVHEWLHDAAILLGPMAEPAAEPAADAAPAVDAAGAAPPPAADAPPAPSTT